MPLGGLGTGSIALCGDGSLRQWQIHNQVNHTACIPHSFFAVWLRDPLTDAPATVCVLQSSKYYDTQIPLPPPTSNDHIVPTAQRRLLEQLPGKTILLGSAGWQSIVDEYRAREPFYHGD